MSGSDLATNRRGGVALVEVLDETLGTGVTVAGDVVLSVADVDLVVLRLRALLASVQSLYDGEIAQPNGGSERGPEKPAPTSPDAASPEHAAAPRVERSPAGEPPSFPDPPATRRAAPKRTTVEKHSAPPERGSGQHREGRLNVDPHDVSRGLAQLILTVVELLRELMERQAIRRVEGGSLTDDQIERVGLGLKRLKEAVEGLREELGLDEEDLNLDLGPLGRLL